MFFNRLIHNPTFIKKPFTTYSKQSSLPHLPVPELESTANKWLETIKPVVTGSELVVAKNITLDFIKKDGVGHLLQTKLIERKEKKKETSWLADWWRSYAYLEYRESIVINVSFTYLFDTPPTNVTQISRAADLTAAFIYQKHQIETEKFPVDVIRGVNQCMASFPNMFGVCRVPAPIEDTLIRYKAEESRHIIVAIDNLFYQVVVQDEYGIPLSRDDIEALLIMVKEDAKKSKGTQPAVGILTTEHRDKWTEIRKEMINNESNKLGLETIQKSAFILNLDSHNPQSENEALKLLLHGQGSTVSSSNRFYDKTFNIVVFPDGRAGLIGEHSHIDGYPTTILSDMILESERTRKGLESTGAKSHNLKQPTIITWSKDKNLLENIKKAELTHNKNVSNLDLNLLRFKLYGQTLIKNIGVSPDAFVQMAFQLSFFRLHKSFAPTYESCSTRKFLHGRTEVGRSLSMDAVEFVSGMQNESLGHAEKLKLFKKACDSHINYIKSASEGMGCDRHILGLKFLAQENKITHPFFDLSAHSRSTHWQLSTSQLSSKYSITGYGPVISDGYGLCYNIRPNELDFHISSFNEDEKTDALKLSKSLNDTLVDLRLLCESDANSKL